MKKINNYQDILKIIQESQSSNSNQFKYLQKILTVDDIKDLESCIKNRNTLLSYRENHDINSQACAILFREVLPLLFSDKEINDYFLEVMLDKYNDINTWVKPKKDELFLEISGYTIDGSSKRDLYPGIKFNHVYDNIFIPNYFYPESYKQETLDLINDNKSLETNYKLFKEKLAVGDDSYLVYLDYYIIDRVGENKFELYIKIMVQEYLNSLEIKTLSNVTNDRLLGFIFGYSWVFSMHLYNYVSGKRKNKPKHYRLHIILLRQFFPHTIGNYQSRSNRNSIYKLLNYSDEQIKEFELISQSIDWNNPINYITSPEITVEINLPSGKTLSKLYEQIDDYFNTIKSTKRIISSKTAIINELITESNDICFSKDIKYLKGNTSRKGKLTEYIETKIIETKKYFYENNHHELIENKDVYTIYHTHLDNFRSLTTDFTVIKSNIIKNELRLFIRDKSSTSNPRNANRIISFLSYVEEEYGVGKTKEISQWQILQFLHYLEVDKKNEPITINNYLSAIKVFITFLMNSQSIFKPSENPALNINLANISEHVVPTQIIPDDILIFLDNHIHELRQTDSILIYKLLIETGWRFGDIKSILSKNINTILNNNELASISVSTPKTKRSRINRGLGDKLEDVISLDLYNQIQKFINETQVIRDMYNIETLFFNIVDNVVSPISSFNFNKAINKLCKKHNIVSIDSTYFSLSTRQTRKTVASALITSGAPTSAIQKKLGHVTTQTTEKYYAEVQQKKISELNTEFYKQKFDIYLDKEKLKLFTEDERKILYIDFCTNKRDVEGLGFCSKHPSEGSCKILGLTTCSNCPKLCTGKSYLEQWEKLASDSKLLLNQFISTYEKYNIEEREYKSYIEYKQEHKLYTQYISVIEAIKKEDL